MAPLQNRVDPFGDLHATPHRGALMGNRGGRFHDATRRLATRRFVSRRWIACRCDFKDRHRAVWGQSYTELFFLDEVTALAAGHRPCFECRREDAMRFASAFGDEHPTRADEMDRAIDDERRENRRKRIHVIPIDTLPDGAMITRNGRALATRGDALLPWSLNGYGEPLARPIGVMADTLTPPSILRAIVRGYAPAWDPSAKT